MSLSRRDLLQAAALGVAFGVLGCRSSAPDAPVATTTDPFEALRRLRESVRRSPDHLEFVARALVAKKDAAGLHRFVRDQIRTLPDDADGFASPVRAMRWGTRAALRCGAGTPREKAELLMKLYRAAGFDAEVVAGRVALPDDDPFTLLRGYMPTDFAPRLRPEDNAVLTAVARGGAEPSRLPPLDPDDRAAAALATRLADLLGDLLTAPVARVKRRSIELPLVRLRTRAGVQLANPNVPGADFNADVLMGPPSTAAAPLATPTVRIALLASRSSAPDERIELVSAAWTAADLAGRQVILGFPPPVAAAELLRMRIDQVRTVLPLIGLRGATLNDVERARQTRTGRAITLQGDLIDLDANGAVRLNEEPLAEATPNPALLARVASLTVTARGTAFPSVLLDVTARDAAGVAIEGLPASAFVCQEENTATSALLLRNRRAPRVLLLLDGSASLPADFRGGGALRVIRSMADALLADVPGLRVRVRAIGERPKAEPWLTDADAIEDAARTHLPRSFESGLWQSLSDARTAADPTVVVLITDGKASDQPRPEWLARIASGPPAVLVGVGAAEKATLAALAAASGGVSTAAATPDAAVAAVRRLLGERADAAHQLRYVAPADGPSTRAVRVSIAGRSLAATASYIVPDATARVRPDALAGLYVSVESGREVHLRTLAEGPPAEVEAALFGTAVLAFEGGPPTAAAWLDDVFTGMLAQEPILRAIAAKDDRATAAALAKAPYAVTAECFAYQPQWHRANDGNSCTFANGLSAVLITARRRPGKPGLRRVDVLPMLHVSTIGADGGVDARRTLERTARLALIEQAGFSKSTASLLAGKELVLVPPGRAVATVLRDLDADKLTSLARIADAPVWRARARLVAADASVAAFWAVTPRNGTLIGVLPDGSGGGEVEEINAVFQRASNILNNIGVAASMLGGSYGFGAWLSVEQTKLTKLHAATLTLATLEAQPGDIGSLGELPCSLATGAVGPVLKGIGARTAEQVADWISKGDSVLGAYGGGGICSKL